MQPSSERAGGKGADVVWVNLDAEFEVLRQRLVLGDERHDACRSSFWKSSSPMRAMRQSGRDQICPIARDDELVATIGAPVLHGLDRLIPVRLEDGPKFA